MNRNYEIIKDCRFCHEVHRLKVRKIDVKKVRDGMHIQNAMPYLTADEREILISGVCGKCFDDMFKENDV